VAARSFTRPVMLGIAAALLWVGACAADNYQTNLGPMPLDDETKAVIAGRGDVTASFDGGVLTVKGMFHDLPSAATEAHIFMGPATAVPGKSVFDLTLSQATSGTLSGNFKLSGAQAAALRSGKFYIQIDSEKAPPGYPWGPKGTLWGWLLPAHDLAGQDVPQQGHWFIPQQGMPTR